MEGEIRYCLVRFGHPSIVSAGIRGRFSSEAYRAAGIDRLSYIGVSTTINSSFHYDNRNEPGQEPAWSIEELVAGVEMDWWYDASWRTRHVVKSWLENEQQHLRPQGEAARILYAMLEAPWDRVRDERACFRRALEALSRERGGNFPYGSPERCRAMVWWYLNRRPIGRDDYYFAVNPERWAALEALEATGNPWGARPEELTRLAELAREAVEAGGEREREEAGKVLMQPWIPR